MRGSPTQLEKCFSKQDVAPEIFFVARSEQPFWNQTRKLDFCPTRSVCKNKRRLSTSKPVTKVNCIRHNEATILVKITIFPSNTNNLFPKHHNKTPWRRAQESQFGNGWKHGVLTVRQRYKTDVHFSSHSDVLLNRYGSVYLASKSFVYGNMFFPLAFVLTSAIPCHVTLLFVHRGPGGQLPRGGAVAPPRVGRPTPRLSGALCPLVLTPGYMPSLLRGDGTRRKGIPGRACNTKACFSTKHARLFITFHGVWRLCCVPGNKIASPQTTKDKTTKPGVTCGSLSVAAECGGLRNAGVPKPMVLGRAKPMCLPRAKAPRPAAPPRPVPAAPPPRAPQPAFIAVLRNSPGLCVGMKSQFTVLATTPTHVCGVLQVENGVDTFTSRGPAALSACAAASCKSNRILQIRFTPISNINGYSHMCHTAQSPIPSFT